MTTVVVAVVSIVVGLLVGMTIVGRLGAALTVNPSRLWAFTDIVKKSTIESYTETLDIRIQRENKKSMDRDEIIQLIHQHAEDTIRHTTRRREPHDKQNTGV